MPKSATTQPIPTESQLALLKRIARRAETGCPFTILEVAVGSSERHDLGKLCAHHHLINTRPHSVMIVNAAGHAAIEAGLATKPCTAEGCPELITFEPDGEEVEYCSERCESAREGL